jgi:hypothetical protein
MSTRRIDEKGTLMKKKQPTHDPLLKAVYLEAVDAQLRENNPPETRQTFERLRAEGVSEQDARLLIGSVIAAETYATMKSGTPFNRDRFIRNLKVLPDQPSLEE